MRFIAVALLNLVSSQLFCQQFILLWPSDNMPNSRNLKLENIEDNQRITQVSRPGIYAFFPSKEENKGSAVLICPSGGYEKLTYNIAGFQFAKWFNTLGINAFVLIYRLPNSPDLFEREKGPVQDAQRAMKLIKANADKWNIDTSKVGIMGASAGGHLAAFLGTHSSDLSLTGDSLDAFSFAPDFTILISPVITMGEFTHKGSRNNLLGESPAEEKIVQYSNELHVNSDSPPAFLVHAQNDLSVSPMNSVLFYQAMMKHGVAGSLHIFPQGSHSIALKNNPGSTDQWITLCEEWLTGIGILNK